MTRSPSPSQAAAPLPAAPLPAAPLPAAPAVPAPRPSSRSSTVAWRADPYATALRTGRGPLFLRRADGWLLPLDVERWCAGADSSDMSVLRRCEGSVLDIGCGPGRLVAALAAMGRVSLGIDVSPAAVARTVGEGGQALRRSVFDPLPGEGRWGTALLIDGNIGIGGDPRALLERVAAIVAPGGLALVEAAPGDLDERVRVRIDDGRGTAASGTVAVPAARGLRTAACADTDFPWARVGIAALHREARAAGWSPAGQWTHTGRPFTALRRDGGGAGRSV
ncbi:methyltransferase domain-containing protein [Streptomyces sp. NPDC048639]|uniref:methyltransferase domain-containing protein n=1 Tax=Streptomyces sp. NPDC048639 TaxID=3365581 RepID=UPI00371BC35B